MKSDIACFAFKLVAFNVGHVFSMCSVIGVMNCLFKPVGHAFSIKE